MKYILNFQISFYHHCQRLIRRLQKKSTWAFLICDAMFIVLSHIFAHLIRFDFTLKGTDIDHFLHYIPLFILFRLPVFYISGMYSGMWRYTGLRDVWNIAKGVIASTLAIVAYLVFENRFEGYSRSVIVLDTAFVFLSTVSLRVAVRCLFLHKEQDRCRLPQKPSKRLLIIGAGSSGEKMCREIMDNPSLAYKIVGFLDDNPSKVGQRIHNIPVWGSVDKLQTCVNEVSVDEILIAISAINGKDMQRLVAACKNTKLPYKIIPGYGEVIDGRVATGMREISYKDLLGRKEVDLDIGQIGGYLNDKVVLITGGGGSIGSELTRQITKFKPKTIVIFEAGEENLYNIQMELLHEFGLTNVVPILGKVQDQNLLNMVFNKYRPQVIFHAAAYKHVPLVENNPWQAVDNNIVASQLLIEAAIIYGVERFVIVSTDKAVRPTNVMGASKRMTELLMHAYQKNNWQGNFSAGWDSLIDLSTVEHNTVFMAVRFGNVLGSSGSVIPLFKRQIKNGGPLTVTHPEVTRYFMSIEEAAQLILQAGSMGRGGEIFILKMGESIKIVDMAKDLIELAGKKVGEDIEVVFTGLRPGEKLYEELITDGEGIIETDHEKIMVLIGDTSFNSHQMIQIVTQLQDSASTQNVDGVLGVLKENISEYATMTKSF